MYWKVATLQRALVLVTVVILVTTVGCTTLGNEDTEPRITTAQSTTGDITEATRTLREAGYADPYLDVEPTGVVHEFELYANDFGVLNPYGDKELWVISLSEHPDDPGTVPGPEIRVKQGDTVRVTLHTPNSDFPGHTLHWHGYDVPWEMDGVPFVTQDIAPVGKANTQTYEFVAKQPGTYWYHCVTSFPTDVDVGLFGAFIVEPQDPDADLPYDREATLLFHEMDSQWLAATGWAANENLDPNPATLPSNPVDLIDSAKQQARSNTDVAGQVAGGNTGVYPFTEEPRDYYPGASPRYKPEYDTFMINGKSYPDTDPLMISEGETLRLRLINAGQLHKSIHLHGHKMLVTHVDGYPLDRPHFEDTLHLAPGERKDVYVQGTNPGIWSFHDHSGQSGMGSTSTNDHAFPGGMKTVLVYEDFEPTGQPAKPGNGAVAGDFAVYAPSYLRR